MISIDLQRQKPKFKATGVWVEDDDLAFFRKTADKLGIGLDRLVRLVFRDAVKESSAHVDVVSDVNEKQHQ